MRLRLGSWSDARAAGAAAVAATIIIAFQLAGKATRDALFLSTFGAAALPPMVIAAAVLSAVLSVILARIMAQSRPGRLVPRLFALSALLLLAEWGLGLEARRPTAILVYLHFTALGAILVSGFWAIVNERFDPRSARRAIGRITAGGSLGGLLGGLLPQWAGAALPLTAMLLILAGLHLLAGGLVLGVQHGTPSAISPAERQQESEPVLRSSQVLRASPYLMGLGLLVALTSAAEGVLDYVFKVRATAATPTGEQLLRLFAAFYTATALLGILVQVTALRRLLGTLGIARSASILPAGVAAGSVGAFVVPGLGPVMLARGLEVVLRSSFFRAAYELLFTPVAPREKRATKLLLDVGAARVGDVAGGLIILGTLVTGAAAGRVLLAVTFALSVGALLVARRLQLGYIGALEGTLQRRAAELPDPVEDDAAALLQTVGAFDLSGIRSRAAIRYPSPEPLKPHRLSAPASPVETPLSQAIHGGQADEVREALSQHPLTPDQIESAVGLLAWDDVVSQVIRSLSAVAQANTRVLVQHLLDPEEDFAIRRRLVNVLADCRSEEAFEGLFRALNDQRFEVRYRAGRALSRMAGEMPSLAIDRENVLRVVRREIGVGRGVWESRQLIDALDEAYSPMQTELLRDRADRSLEHLFNLLSLILPRETLRLAFHGLHTDDRYLRGTALEYLETVLPESLWTTLRPLLEPGERQTRPRRPSGQVLEDLLASRESIVLAISRERRGPSGQDSGPEIKD